MQARTATLPGLVLAACLAFPGPAAAQSYGDGVAAYSLQNFERARQIWQKYAEDGNTEAQYRLGLLFEQGKGVAADDAEARRWYEKAANGGNSKAQMALANFFATGRGGNEDPYQAWVWFLAAANGGEPRAQYHVGQVYMEGGVVEVDPLEAYKWIERAAAQDDDLEVKAWAEDARDRLTPYVEWLRAQQKDTSPPPPEDPS